MSVFIGVMLSPHQLFIEEKIPEICSCKHNQINFKYCPDCGAENNRFKTSFKPVAEMKDEYGFFIGYNEDCSIPYRGTFLGYSICEVHDIGKVFIYLDND